MGSRRFSVLGHHFDRYPHQLLEEYSKFRISKPTTKNESYLIYFTNEWGEDENSCILPTELIYREQFVTKTTDDIKGYATYKLSLYDLRRSKCICVRLTVDCDDRSDAILAFKEKLNFKEDTEMLGASLERTPEEVYRYFPSDKKTEKSNTTELQANSELFSPTLLEDNDVFTKKVDNYELYITLEFSKWGKLDFQMLAANQSTILNITPDKEQPEKKESRRLKTKPKKKKSKSPWGLKGWADNMLTEDQLDVETVVKVHELQNAAQGEKAPQTAVVVGWLLAVILKRML